MSKMKQHRSKSASKTVKTVSLNTFHAPIVAYAFWRLTLEARPKRFKLVFHTLEEARRHHRDGRQDRRADGPIQKLTSMPSKHQAALTRAIARHEQIERIAGTLYDLNGPGSKKAGRLYRRSTLALLKILKAKVAAEEGLTEDGRLL